MIFGARRSAATLGGVLAMLFVGGSVAVSGRLGDAPLGTVQAVRYGISCVLLLAVCRLRRHTVRRPHGAEWLWLAGVTVMGLVVFNIALVEGAEHAEPSVLGVAVACVPVALAVIGPVLEGTSPAGRALAAASVVTAGGALVQGYGHCDAVGLGWALVVFACESGFTLLAVPLLERHGAYGVSVHTTWMATVAFGVIGVLHEGPAAVLRLDRADWVSIGYLAVLVTAGAFVLWYGCVAATGAARAGLLTGIAPGAAAVVGLLLGGPAPGPGVWAGMVVVAAGLVLGLRSRTVRRRGAVHRRTVRPVR